LFVEIIPEVLEEALADLQTRNGGQSRDRQYGGDQLIDNGTVYCT